MISEWVRRLTPTDQDDAKRQFDKAYIRFRKALDQEAAAQKLKMLNGHAKKHSNGK